MFRYGFVPDTTRIQVFGRKPGTIQAFVKLIRRTEADAGALRKLFAISSSLFADRCQEDRSVIPERQPWRAGCASGGEASSGGQSHIGMDPRGARRGRLSSTKPHY